jgi:hypothetical protein
MSFSSFLSHCRCNGSECSCDIDDHHQVHFQKGTPMSALDEMVKTLETLSPEQKRELIKRLSASSVAKAPPKTRVEKIAAMRADRTPAFTMAEGELKRLGIKIDDVDSVLTLNKLFAASSRKPTTDLSMAIKSQLFGLGLIEA